MSVEKEIVIPENTILVSKTDTQGKIVYANQEFMKVSGYTESQLMGHPHNMIRHPDMPRVVFKMLWEYLKRGSEIHAYVKNRSKDGSYYWVLANVFPIFDLDHKIIGYHSSRRHPKSETLAIIEPIYKGLLEIEKTGGLEASQKYLNQLLESKGVDYDQFILSI